MFLHFFCDFHKKCANSFYIPCTDHYLHWKGSLPIMGENMKNVGFIEFGDDAVTYGAAVEQCMVNKNTENSLILCHIE